MTVRRRGAPGGGAGSAVTGGGVAPAQPIANDATTKRNFERPLESTPKSQSRMPERARVYFRTLASSAMRLTLLLLLVPALTLGCSVDNSSAALSGHIDGPTLDVQSSSVGGDATGTFSLQIELGDYASSDTQVSLGTFSIQRGDTELLAPLSLAGATFPVSLGVGQKVMLPMTFTGTVDASSASALCDGTVQLQGTLTDSLSDNHPTILTSSDFSASCN